MRRSSAVATLGMAVAPLLAGPVAARAQGEGGSALPWSATLFYDAQEIARTPEAAYWHTVTAGVAARVPHGSIGVQVMATRRFDLSDQAVIVDAYHDLWGGAYGNLRVGGAPGAEVLARFDAGAELFQAVGRGELSASYRFQSFEASDVSTLGAGLGYYAGNWYLRPRTVVAHVDEAWSPFVAFTARRYFGDTTDNLIDLASGMGEEVLEVAAPATGAGPLDVITSGSRFASLRAQRYIGRHFGVTAGVSYSDYAEIPNRWGMSLGLLARW